MSKNILVLSSSPRKKSNSDRLCEEFMRGAQEAGHQAEKIALRGKTIEYCIACEACQRNNGVCVHKDDMAAILERMIAADVIVLATPVYFYSMCAQMKTLIDRVYARYTEIVDKECYLILTAADSDVKNMERTVEGLRGFLWCLTGAVEKGVIYGVGAWKEGDIAGSPAMQGAYEAGKSV